jgi:hypothetical protein
MTKRMNNRNGLSVNPHPLELFTEPWTRRHPLSVITALDVSKFPSQRQLNAVTGLILLDIVPSDPTELGDLTECGRVVVAVAWVNGAYLLVYEKDWSHGSAAFYSVFYDCDKLSRCVFPANLSA